MNGRTLLLFVCLVCSSRTMYAQDILSTEIQYRIDYQFSYKRDSTTNQYYGDHFALDIGSGVSFFYSRIKFYRDSVKAAVFAATGEIGTTLDAIRPLERGSHWYTVREFANNRIALFWDTSLQVFQHIYPLEIPAWKLMPDTLTVSGYVCNKATGFIQGRKWDVWYTPEIPLNEGPWLLWGLPGLVLKAEEANGYFSFENTGIVQMISRPTLLLPHHNKRTRQINLATYKKIEASALSNDYSFIDNLNGILKIEAYNADGSPSIPERKKFIPLIK